MNTVLDEAKALVEELKSLVNDVKGVEIVVCPPFISLGTVYDIIKDTNIELGAQNVYWEKSGAFTAEVSAPMLKSVGCSYVIIGHSERRSYFGETNDTVNKRIFAALEDGLKAIVCVGETLEEREADKTFDVIKQQILGGLADLTQAQMKSIVIAYEPVWAIGTGKTATKEQAQDVHAYIRKLLADQFGDVTAESTRIQYGGSVKPENAAELMSQPDIDGALVGGAALNAASFEAIVKF